MHNSMRRPALLAAAAAFAGCLTPLAAAQKPLDPLPSREWTCDAAAHLLRRAGFGGTPAEVRALHGQGLEGAVSRLVDYTSIAYDPAPPALDPAVFEPLVRDQGEELGGLKPAELMDRMEQERRSHQETRLWWIERMVESPRPLEERMTLFWHGHFTSGAREVKRSLFMFEQNQMLRRNAMGPFRELVLAVSRDRAMLVYLDNARNRKAQPNENFARELLELFTLGEGRYGEEDIKAAARAFTGWSLDREGFRFYRIAHDYGRKTFLGKTGAWDGEDIVDIILEQPACAEHLARKLLTFFVEPEPDGALVAALAREIRRREYRLRPVMHTLLSSRAFYAPRARGALVKSPVDLLVGAARQFGLSIHQLDQAERALANLGQTLMQPPNVRGWPGGPHWITTATLANRYNSAASLIEGRRGVFSRGGPAGARGGANPTGSDAATTVRAEAAATMKPDADKSMKTDSATTTKTEAARSRRNRGEQPAFDPLPMLRAASVSAPAEVVDFLAGHMLATPLAIAKRDVIVEYLSGPTAFDLSKPDAADRVRTAIVLIASTPEYQLK